MLTLSNLGKRLKELRESLGFSQEYVAQHLGIHRHAILAIESGRRKVDSFELFKLAELYNVNAADLIAEKTSSPTGLKEAILHLRKAGELTDEERAKLMEFQKICADYDFLKTL